MTRDVQLMFSSSNESFPNVSRFVLATQIFKTKSKLIRERERKEMLKSRIAVISGREKW